MSEPDSLSIGQPLPRIGSYRLMEPLGSGGMSSVFKAVHADSGHEVAVKVLPRSLAKNPTLLQRFLREAKSAEALEHPNIVAIFDRGSEAGRYYLVLELVDGGDLHDRVRDHGPFAIDEAVRVLGEVAQGLKYAAGKGVIHRDIKPANILLGHDGRVKVTDLGLALQEADEDERVTRDGTTVGTVDYMSPEQARDSRATSFRSDIYSLGCTAYFILTGKPPFVGGDLADKLRRHAVAPPPDVRESRPEVPEALAKLILRMMAKKPEGRPASYDELLVSLAKIADHAGEAEEPLVALIDDEDDSGPDFSLGAGDLLALDSAPATVEGLQTRRDRLGREASQKTRSEVSLSELAALDEDDAPRPIRKRKPASEAIVPVLPKAPASRFEEDDVFPMGSAPGESAVGLRRLGEDVDLARVDGRRRRRADRRRPPAVDRARPSDAAGGGGGGIGVERGAEAGTARRGREHSGDPPKNARKDRDQTRAVAPGTRVECRLERAGGDPGGEGRGAADRRVDRGEIPAGLGSRRHADPARWPFVVVRRLESGRDPTRASTLGKAFDQPGGTVEIADDGPFFEDDLHAGTKARLIRARPDSGRSW